ncbi:hypothetical protein KP509_38G029100 [Ceratopteris richardii]|uniref:Uncharacterized protein n=1 Tax=Ceratopteris richardii TaxID=49495 RepID=A0A8T2Q3G2_CERRI|nr:hypothetical protein KP509_38G029100 [Ceratopteris richardii]
MNWKFAALQQYYVYEKRKRRYFSRWKGNCFNSDSRAHDEKCHDDTTCASGPPKSDGTSKSSSTAVIASAVIVVAVLCVILVVSYIFWSRADICKARSPQR